MALHLHWLAPVPIARIKDVAEKLELDPVAQAPRETPQKAVA